jgi:hypothetical protein
LPKPQKNRPLTIGWKERIDFPEWNLRRVKAKVDTGARTSALDVSRCVLRTLPDGLVLAELHLALFRRRPERIVVVDAPVLGMVVVANSAGMCEERPLIETTLRLGNVVKRIRLTVTSRHGMRFAVILGRKALEDDFIVDVSRKYLQRD